MTMSGKQPGDPVRAAQAIVEAVNAPQPPKHLILGKVALNRFRGKLDAWQQEIAQWESTTRLSSDYTRRVVSNLPKVRTITLGYWRRDSDQWLVTCISWRMCAAQGKLGIDLKRMTEGWRAVHDSMNYYWERGLMSAQDFFEQTVLRPNAQRKPTFEAGLWKLVCAGESRHPFRMLCTCWMSVRGAKGYRVATLNNESPELNEYRLDTFGLRKRFDYFICSGYVHEMKPLPGIYRAAIAISGHGAEQALFIDDKQENCDAAAALGMCAIRFESPDGHCDLPWRNTVFIWRKQDRKHRIQERMAFMELGIIGLGKMGGNMAERLRLAGHKVVGFDFSREAVDKLTAAGSLGVSSLEDLVKNLRCTTRDLDHGACGRSGGPDHRQAGADDAEGRYVYRWRQFKLQGLAASPRRGYCEGIQFHRCRDVRRRPGASKEGLQSDDRWR